MVDRPDTTDDVEPLEGADAEPSSQDDGPATDDEGVDVAALQARAAEAEALADKLKRVEADFVNETKRIRRQAEQDRKYAIETVVVDLLPVMDALHSARDSLGEGEAAGPMREGLSLIEKQLDAIFQRHGIAAIDALGQAFDPARHQAMLVVERDDCEPQTVCEVLRIGYELHGRVVRPSEVIVAKATSASAAVDDGEGAEASEEA